jgi:hypothetical protein
MPPDTLPDTPGTNHREMFAMLCGELPPPADGNPDTRAMHERGAMDAVIALHPMDAFEARLAVRIVAADAHAGDSLRLAGLAANDPAEMHRCRAQAASMSRQSDAALRSLLRIQAIREKQETAMHPAAMERAGYWFKEIPVPAPSPSHEPATAPQPAADAECDPIQADTDAEAELYAAIYPDRAARIRAAGGLPAKLDFGPPEPEIVASLLRSAHRPDAARAA